MYKRIVPMAVAALMCVAAAGAQATPALGEAPPDYLGKTPDGEEVRISERRGKVVMVSFWASWCGYCRRQFPMLDTFQTRVGRDRLEVILVNFKESARDYRAVRRDLKRSPVTWTHDADGVISDAYDVRAVPRLFVIDKSGELAYTLSGYSDEMLPELVDVVNELLAEPGPGDTAPAPEADADAG